MSPQPETDPRPAFRLVIFGDGSVRTVPLQGNRWVIGRAHDADITVRDLTVSRRHVLLERHQDQFCFQDMGSSNPILLDGKLAHHGALQPGQTLQIGLSRLVLELRRRPLLVRAHSDPTMVLSREMIDEDAAPPVASPSLAAIARRVLERMEWTFADLGDLSDVAEPMLDLALNLTGRRRGLIGSLLPDGRLTLLANMDLQAGNQPVQLPAAVLREAQQLQRPQLLTSQEQGRNVERLMVPLGDHPSGLLVLEDPAPDALRGQELLRLASVLGRVTWHRLQESGERLRLRTDAERLRFQGNAIHQALLTSTRLHTVRHRLRELANHDHPVLLLGEPGTEREELARYLHAESQRNGQAFVALDFGNLPPTIWESALFEPSELHGSALQRAEGGTLFLERIDLLPEPLQLRLLASLEQTDGKPAAERTEAPRVLRPRLVAACTLSPGNAAGPELPRLGRLFASATLCIPPLRQEPRDILALAELYLAWLGAAPDGSPRLLNERTRPMLVAYAWPGNVRELRQVIEAAAAAAGNQAIAPRHLAGKLGDATAADDDLAVPTLAELEQRHMREVLERCGGNRARAAQMLGIATSTLYERLRRHGLD